MLASVQKATMRPDDEIINEAARQLRARLETMLEQLPESDPSHMPVETREAGRQRWRRARVGGSRPRQTSARTTSRKEVGMAEAAEGKTAALDDIDWSGLGVWLG